VIDEAWVAARLAELDKAEQQLVAEANAVAGARKAYQVVREALARQDDGAEAADAAKEPVCDE
jgi:hypothetical protein